MPTRQDKTEKTASGWQEIVIYTEEITIRKISSNPYMSVKEFGGGSCPCCKIDFPKKGNVWFVLTNLGARHICDKCVEFFREQKSKINKQ